MEEGDDALKSRSRKHRREKDKRSERRRHRYHRYEDSESKDEVSCCGHPRQLHRSDSRRRRHRRHHRRHKSRGHHRSQKEIPTPLRPPTPPQPQSAEPKASVSKEKQKDEKESCEMTSTNQGKLSTSGEITGQIKSNSQLGTSQLLRDNQKVEGRENAYNIVASKGELLQELCVTQCIRDGYEISRMAYTTYFPISKKPNFIYLPQMRFVPNDSDALKKLSTQSSRSSLSHEIAQSNNICQNQTFNLTKEKNFSPRTKIVNFMENLNECCLALRKARRNISNLKLLTSGEVLSEVHRYDTSTKAIINDLKHLEQRVERKLTTT
uniref:Luc7-like protein 3 n=1 Tax=Elaeophora elaphi TaxID=1147741 RepID=A0A0R3RHN5_9BILA